MAPEIFKKSESLRHGVVSRRGDVGFVPPAPTAPPLCRSPCCANANGQLCSWPREARRRVGDGRHHVFLALWCVPVQFLDPLRALGASADWDFNFSRSSVYAARRPPHVARCPLHIARRTPHAPQGTRRSTATRSSRRWRRSLRGITGLSLVRFLCFLCFVWALGGLLAHLLNLSLAHPLLPRLFTLSLAHPRLPRRALPARLARSPIPRSPFHPLTSPTTAHLSTHPPSTEEYWANVSETARDFVRECLTIDPTSRPTAAEALRHPWLAAEKPYFVPDPESPSGRPTDLLPHIQRAFDAKKTCAYFWFLPRGVFVVLGRFTDCCSSSRRADLCAFSPVREPRCVKYEPRNTQSARRCSR